MQLHYRSVAMGDFRMKTVLVYSWRCCHFANRKDELSFDVQHNYKDKQIKTSNIIILTLLWRRYSNLVLVKDEDPSIYLVNILATDDVTNYCHNIYIVLPAYLGKAAEGLTVFLTVHERYFIGNIPVWDQLNRNWCGIAPVSQLISDR